MRSEATNRRFRVELVRSRSLSPSVRSLVFRADDDGTLRWRAGQYVELELGPGVRKPYSIASAMGVHGPSEFEIAVALGQGSEPLEALTTGATLSSFGPSGSLERARTDAPVAFLAVGTGLSPFRAMIQDELSRSAATPVLLLFGCRSELDILWQTELGELAAKHPRFRYEPTLSRPVDGWSGRRGWVQAHLEELVAPFAQSDADVFVCGLSAMVTDCVRRLETDLGIPRARIFTERC